MCVCVRVCVAGKPFYTCACSVTLAPVHDLVRELLRPDPTLPPCLVFRVVLGQEFLASVSQKVSGKKSDLVGGALVAPS